MCFQWFEEKLQEVECEEQRLRKLHAVVETLVNHRKGKYPFRHTPALGKPVSSVGWRYEACCSQPSKWKLSAHLLHDVLISKICPALLSRNMTSITLGGGWQEPAWVHAASLDGRWRFTTTLMLCYMVILARYGCREAFCLLSSPSFIVSFA